MRSDAAAMARFPAYRIALSRPALQDVVGIHLLRAGPLYVDGRPVAIRPRVARGGWFGAVVAEAQLFACAAPVADVLRDAVSAVPDDRRLFLAPRCDARDAVRRCRDARRRRLAAALCPPCRGP